MTAHGLSARSGRCGHARLACRRRGFRLVLASILCPNHVITEQTDFIALYSELGIVPDCTVDDLRLAYRRRVADLHPDRVGAVGEDALKTLNLRYAAVLDFHRHYGRLPGAAPAPMPRRAAGREESVHERWDDEGADAPELEQPESRRQSRVVVYGIMLLAILLVWWLSRTDAESLGFHVPGVVAEEREKASHAATALHPGMTREQVVALLGQPITRESDDGQWLYGPSWVRFECGGVSDWYSSPLKPLKASSSRPSAADDARAVDRPRGCAPGAGSNHPWQAR
ncbi:MAG TPA: outer membrane protein assembly factor BamE [Luteimonas sp.]|nr:outer membrane protein assembly factor BamE [Luteimonas sp.]